MKTRYLTFFLLAALAATAEHIPIVITERATATERTAAGELAAYLGRLYPAETFAVVSEAPRTGKLILVGTEMPAFAGKARPTVPESFTVTTAMRNGAPAGIIAGADPRGVLYGVYALLENLGWGFYLSYEAAPDPRKQPLSFTEWNLQDEPVFRDRVVFDWHNFLSSASTWEWEDWRRWIAGAARMRYNTVMVHAYATPA